MRNADKKNRNDFCSLVYVIVNEPTFGLLKEALEKSDNMTDSLILEDDAALYYNFVCNIAIDVKLL